MSEESEGDGEKLPHVTMTMSMDCGSIRVLARRSSMEENIPSWASWFAEFSVGILSSSKMKGGPYVSSPKPDLR